MASGTRYRPGGHYGQYLTKVFRLILNNTRELLMCSIKFDILHVAQRMQSEMMMSQQIYK